MSVTPSDLLHNKKDLNKKIDVEDIDLSEISIEDLVFNKKNYKNYINLKSLLEGVSTCKFPMHVTEFQEDQVLSKN